MRQYSDKILVTNSILIPSEEYTYHTSPVNVALFDPDDPTTFISAGNAEGIFFWNFQGDTSPPVEDTFSPEFISLRTSAALPASHKLGFTAKSEGKVHAAEQV